MSLSTPAYFEKEGPSKSFGQTRIRHQLGSYVTQLHFLYLEEEEREAKTAVIGVPNTIVGVLFPGYYSTTADAAAADAEPEGGSVAM